MSKSRTEMVALLEPTVEALGYELSDLELNFSGRRGVLRLFIDHPGAADRPAGPGTDMAGTSAASIRVEDCEAVSRQVSAVLDVEDPIRRDYDLEVSSPGLDRPLAKREHFVRFVGATVNVRLRRPLEGRRRFVGTLRAVEAGGIVVDVDGQIHHLPLDDIERARLVPEY